jgi:hypothetical protein
MKTVISLLLSAIMASDIVAQQLPSATPRGDWSLYAAGQLPQGKPLKDVEAAQLAGGSITDRLYLIGTFTVTASGPDRAVMRTTGQEEPIRIVAIYPPTIPPPPEGATLERDGSRGFEITDVRRGSDGQITIHVREITRPEGA